MTAACQAPRPSPAPYGETSSPSLWMGHMHFLDARAAQVLARRCSRSGSVRAVVWVAVVAAVRGASAYPPTPVRLRQAGPAPPLAQRSFSRNHRLEPSRNDRYDTRRDTAVFEP